MSDVVIVSPRVPVLGRVAASHVSASKTHAQVNPGIAGLHAIFAKMLFRRRGHPDVFQVRTQRRGLYRSYHRNTSTLLCGRSPFDPTEELEHFAIKGRNIVGLAA